MKNNFYTSVAVSTVLLTGISLLVEASFGRALTGNYIGWILLSSLLIVISLGLIARNSIYVGWKLSLFIFSIYFVIGHFNLLIEAYLFDVTNAMDTALVASQGLIISFVFSPLLVRIFGKWEGEPGTLDFPSRTKSSWAWRVVLGDFLYVFLYLLAGMILYMVYPKLMDFYGDKVPPFGLMIGTQFFRALFFIGVAILVSRSTDLPLIQRALVIGLFFAVIGGLAPLIVQENEHMPDYIRFGHTFEVGISNSLYGFLLTLLLGQKIKAEEVESRASATAKSELNPA